MTTPSTTRSEELKPCPVPWCEQNDAPHTWQDCADEWTVICPSCGVNGPIGKTEEEAIDEWSALTPNPDGALREALEEARPHIAAPSLSNSVARMRLLAKIDAALAGEQQHRLSRSPNDS